MDGSSSRNYLSKILEWEKEMEEDGFAFLRTVEYMDQQLKMMSTQLEKLKILQEQYVLATQEQLLRKSSVPAAALSDKMSVYKTSNEYQSNKPDFTPAGLFRLTSQTHNHSYFPEHGVSSLVNFSSVQPPNIYPYQVTEAPPVPSSLQKNCESSSTQTDSELYLQNYNPLLLKPSSSEIPAQEFHVSQRNSGQGDAFVTPPYSVRDTVPIVDTVPSLYAQPEVPGERGLFHNLVNTVTTLAEIPGQYVKASGSMENLPKQNTAHVNFPEKAMNQKDIARTNEEPRLAEHKSPAPTNMLQIESECEPRVEEEPSSVPDDSNQHSEGFIVSDRSPPKNDAGRRTNFIKTKAQESEEENKGDEPSVPPDADVQSEISERHHDSRKASEVSTHAVYPEATHKDSFHDNSSAPPEQICEDDSGAAIGAAHNSSPEKPKGGQRKTSVKFQAENKVRKEDTKKVSEKISSKKSEAAKNKSRASSSATDSDDSFFDRDLPLTSSAAYRSLIGAAVQDKPFSPVQESASESESEDEVERALAMAVKRKPSKADSSLMKSSGKPTELSPPSGSVAKQTKEKASVEKAKMTTKASAAPRLSISASSAASKFKFSKTTRKALGLDSDSDEPPATSSKKNQQESSDEFDFYD